MLYKIMNMLSIDRKAKPFPSDEMETSHVSIEAMSQRPFGVPYIFEELHRVPCINLLSRCENKDKFGRHDGLDHPSCFAALEIIVGLVLGRDIEMQHGPSTEEYSEETAP